MPIYGYSPILKNLCEYLMTGYSSSETEFRITRFEKTDLQEEIWIKRTGLGQSIFENIINPTADSQFRDHFFNDWFTLMQSFVQLNPDYLLARDIRSVFEIEAEKLANIIAPNYASISENDSFTGERLTGIPDTDEELINFRKIYWKQHILNVTENIVKLAIEKYNHDKSVDEKWFEYLLNPAISDEEKIEKMDLRDLGFYFGNGPYQP
jgi:hypothetical protein